jgi:hypothetical protein
MNQALYAHMNNKRKRKKKKTIPQMGERGMKENGRGGELSYKFDIFLIIL